MSLYAEFRFRRQRNAKKSESSISDCLQSLLPFGCSACLSGRVYFCACMKAFLVLAFATSVNVSAAINDDDDDGMPNSTDVCPLTPVSEIADVNGEGCSPSQRDTDDDGVSDNSDECPNTSAGRHVLLNGCAVIDDLLQLGGDIDGEAAGDASGSSVALSSDGTMIAIGARFNNGNGSGSGHVRIYAWNGSAWVQQGADIDGEAAGDESGFSVALSSDGITVAIGAHRNDGNGSNSGHVRIYAWNGSAWVQQGADIDGEAAGDYSGSSVALSSDGTTVAIGAPFNNGGNGSDSGHVRIYTWNGSAWVQQGADIDGEKANEYLGYPVALSNDGTTVAIRGLFNGSGNSHTRVYTWNGSAWVQQGADIEDGHVAPESSVALSSDGTTVAIGAWLNDGNGTASGYVRIYAWNGSVWVQQGADIVGEAADNLAGWSVALSSDGTTVAIGAPYGNGSNSGHARIYTWNGSAWVQQGTDIDGEAADDESGSSVALSSDGTTVAIGAWLNDGNGTASGHVRVYALAPQDSDEDNVADISDAFPLDPSESVDTDGDGTGNNADTDDDNDGVFDIDDAFPLDPGESLDTDGDGIGDNADTDDDGDGVVDTEDVFPLDSTETLDTDGDGVGDNADAFPFDPNETIDSDGDGVGDNTYDLPDDSDESQDSDSDGLGNNLELLLGTDPNKRDSDGDGWSDKDEFEEGSDPLRAASQPEIPSGLPIWMLFQAAKSNMVGPEQL